MFLIAKFLLMNVVCAIGYQKQVAILIEQIDLVAIEPHLMGTIGIERLGLSCRTDTNNLLIRREQ